MYRVGGLFGSRGSTANSSSKSLNLLSESEELQDALQGAGLIMNDDVDGAEEALKNGNSSFHKLGRGVITFMKATLGFEKEIMKEASERLAEAESSASSDHTRVQSHDGPNPSQIYTRGSEFALCTVEAQLMSAIIGVLNESLTESIRGFYKIRKAFITLDSLLAMEVKYVKSLSNTTSSTTSLSSTVSTSSTATEKKKTSSPKQPSSLQHSVTPSTANGGDEEDFDFIDAKETKDGEATPASYTGHLEVDDLDKKLEDVDLKESVESPVHLISPSVHTLLDLDPESTAFSNPVDIFIHSGVNLCFGVLLLIISMIPPAFSRLISIIGFHGDREKGKLLLWQASKFNNIHGALASLFLLEWYNGLTATCDIVPDPTEASSTESQVEGYPAERLNNLLSAASERNPKSQLWLIQRARMAGARRQLLTAQEILKPPCTSTLRQVQGLHMFEKSMNAMYNHDHLVCADSFITCSSLNSWSRSLYYYLAGASHLALYRKLKNSDPEQAAKHAKEAESNFKTAPTHAGKKKIMARQLPFDAFVTRKIQKWEQRAKEWNVPFIDAVGVAPTEEMNYLWNGYRKMNAEQLQSCLDVLAWSEDATQNPTWEKEGLDEKAIIAVLRAAIYRNLRKHDEAMALLKEAVIDHPKASFKGNLRDDWTAPVAHFELGVNLWMQRTAYQRQHGFGIVEIASNFKATGDQQVETDIEHDRPLVAECKVNIEKVRNWEAYDIDRRIGIKITSAVEAIAKWESLHGPAK